MTEIISERTPIARKKHFCEMCGKSIEVGEKYHYKFIVDCGDSWSVCECEECNKAINHLYDTNDDVRYNDEMTYDGLVETILEELQERHINPERKVRDLVLQYNNLFK